MIDLNKLLDLTKLVATEVGFDFLNNRDKYSGKYNFSPDNQKEVKTKADNVLEDKIIKKILKTELSILSEESGYIKGKKNLDYLFIIDPLDGTFNFVKGLGPHAISIALWNNNTPIFGVIFNLTNGRLAWGGKNYGAYYDETNISVSDICDKNKASIHTGFPVRQDLNDVDYFWKIIRQFSKVRMFGSASISLLKVAKGSADVYFEKEIMLWDVAAGLAIVQGGGGSVDFKKGKFEFSLDVYASNNNLTV